MDRHLFCDADPDTTVVTVDIQGTGWPALAGPGIPPW